jgi:hypothetical protein
MNIQEYLFLKWTSGKGLSDNERKVLTHLANLFPLFLEKIENDWWKTFKLH